MKAFYPFRKKIVTGVRVATAPALENIQFPQHYVYELVGSGETKEVFRIDVNGGYVAFIERMAFDWFEGSNPPATRSVIMLVIDGVRRSFEYQIDINKPYVLDPPIVARNRVSWIVTNNDVPYKAADGTDKNGSHYYGILCDGVLAKPKTT